MRHRKPSILRGIVAGITAGIVATLVMDQFQRLSTSSQKVVEKKRRLAEGESEWQIAHEITRTEREAAQQEGSTEIVARKIAQAAGSSLPREKRKAAGHAVHYTFGTSIGAMYAVAAELLPEITTGGGLAFGTLLFFGADEVAVPALKLSPPPSETPAGAQLQHWAAHVVYGGALELTRSLVRRLL